MGGDHGPGVTVPGALAALQAEADLRIVLVGLSEPITRLINEAPAGLRDHHDAPIVGDMKLDGGHLELRRRRRL